MSGRSSCRVTSPPVAFSIASASTGDACRLPAISSAIHVGVILRYSAISLLAPRTSVLKYSARVMVCIILKPKVTLTGEPYVD